MWTFLHYLNSKIPLHKLIFLIFSDVWFNCLVDLVYLDLVDLHIDC